MKIGVITTSRADFGIYLSVLKEIQKSKKHEIYVFALGMHLSEKFGNTVTHIVEEGFNVVPCLKSISEEEDSMEAVSIGMGRTTMAMAQAYAKNPCDVVFCLGDRFEMHGAVSALIPFDVPLLHIHGGEISEGAIDEKFRHSISKLSDYHFTTCPEYKDRVIQLGADPSRVYYVGAPGIDNIKKLDLLDIEGLKERFEVDFSKKTLLGTYQPVTVESEHHDQYINEFIKAIKNVDAQVVMTLGNADTKGNVFREKLLKLSKEIPEKVKVFNNMGQVGYLSAMKYCAYVIGNSSSGIIEAASLNKPVVNIGNRQKGRATSENVIHCKEDYQSIVEAFEKADSYIGKEFQNIYEKENTSHEILEILDNTKFSTSYKFFDIKRDLENDQ